jgi:non-heme chloroperoxidase
MDHTAQYGFAGLAKATLIPVRVDAAGSRAETTVTSCDGHAFVMRRTGTGEPILLLHDMAATQRAWDPIRVALSWSNSVCTWDARGHGASRGTPESAVPTLSLLAADLDAAINVCAPECPVLVGHGLGALTILEYLRNYDPGRVSRVVLVDQSPRMLTVPDWPLGLFGGFRAADALEFEAQIRINFADAWLSLQARDCNPGVRADDDLLSQHRDSPGSDLHPLAPGSMLALWRSMIVRDYRVDLATLQIPLLAVQGGGSNLYDPVQLGRWFHACVPNAQVICYPKAGHSPHAAAPARFALDIAAFAARREPVTQRHVAAIAPNGAGASDGGGKPRPACAQAA